MSKEMMASVLLVDDEEEFLETLSDRLTHRGLKVDSVTSGRDALNRIDDTGFDAIVLDLAMPGINGLETLRRLKEKRPELQIIMLTGHGSTQGSVEAMKSGAQDFLEKPVDLNTLLTRIGEAKNKRAVLVEKRYEDEVRQIAQRRSW